MLSGIKRVPVFRQLQVLKGACVYLRCTSAKLNDVWPVISIVGIASWKKRASVMEKRRKMVIRLAEVIYEHCWLSIDTRQE